MKLRRLYLLPLAILLVALAFFLAAPDARTPRDVIAELPGVGYGWIDTLERVTMHVTLDTINPREARGDFTHSLLGQYEWDHQLISVQPHMIMYSRYARYWDPPSCREQTHPIEVTGFPAGNLAHEYGHLLQSVLRYGNDTTYKPLPRWAQDDDERFADRFARALLALRGWTDPDTSDKVMNHEVRYRLIRSYWED